MHGEDDFELPQHLAPYVPPISDGKRLRFKIFLSSPTDCHLRDTAAAAIKELEAANQSLLPCDLEVQRYEDTVYGASNPTQADIDIQNPIRQAQVVIGFVEYRVGPHTKKEMLDAIAPPAPRPFTLFFAPSESYVKRRTDADSSSHAERRRTEERGDVLDLLDAIEGIHDAVAHRYDGTSEFKLRVKEEVSKYVRSQFEARGMLPEVSEPGPVWSEDRSPYPGLASMKYRDQYVFFGRDDEIIHLKEALRSKRVVCVLGPSGIGKSSLLLSGLLPSLVNDGWSAPLVVDLIEGEIPNVGTDPYWAVVAVLRRLYPDRPGNKRDTAFLLKRLSSASNGLIEEAVALDLLPPPTAPVAFCLDQAEYLISRCDPLVAGRFASAVKKSVDNDAAVFLCTMRYDADTDLHVTQELQPLRDLLGGNTHFLGSLDRRNIVRVIKKPAEIAGYTLEEKLVKALADASEESNALPLLAASLRHIYDQWYARWLAAPPGARPRRVFTLDLFPGFKGIVDRLAEGALSAATVEEKDAPPKLFWRLIRFDLTRARFDKIRLLRRAYVDDVTLTSLIERLATARLLVVESDGVELVHSIVFDLWEDLAVWARNTRDDAEALAYFSMRARRWSSRVEKGGASAAIGDLLSWEDVKAMGALVHRVVPFLTEEDDSIRLLGHYQRESARVRGLLEGIARVDFPLLESAMASPAQLTLTKDEAEHHWAFYCAMNNPSDLKDSDWHIIANRGYRVAHFAAFANNVSCLERAEDDPGWLAVSSGGGWTPLHMAAYSAGLEAADFLLRHGAEIDTVTQDGYTALAIATHRGSIDMVELLLKWNARPNPPQVGATVAPLNIAIATRHGPIIDLLLSHGADPLATDRDGATALHIAASVDALDIFVPLADRVGGPLDIRNGEGKTPLHVAAVAETAEVLRYLLESRRATPSLTVPPDRKEAGRTALHLAARRGTAPACRLLAAHHPESVNVPDHKGVTPLHLAAANDHLEVVKLLLQAGAKTTPVDATGRSSLHFAAHCDAIAVLSFMLTEPGRSNDAAATTTIGSPPGLTPLHLAASASALNACRLLATHVPTWIDDCTVDGITPLRLAVRSDNLDVVELLLECGANPHAIDSNGAKIIHWAFMDRSASVARWLLEPAARAFDVNVDEPMTAGASVSGVTPLHVIQRLDTRDNDGQLNRNDSDAFKPLFLLLLRHGANPNLPDAEGDTALHWAARASRTLVPTALVDAGGRLEERNKDGQRPFEVAANSLNYDVANEIAWLMASKGAKTAPSGRPEPSTVPPRSVAEVEIAANVLGADQADDPDEAWASRLRARWRPLRGRQLQEALADLDASELRDENPRTATLTRLVGARVTDAPCYSGFVLVELLAVATADAERRIIAFLWGPDVPYAHAGGKCGRAIVLNGESARFHELNFRLPLMLGDAVAASFYLTLFTTYLRADDGAFIILDSASDLSLVDERAQFAWRRVCSRIKKMELAREEARFFDFRATILYGRRLFESALRVYRWGCVEMIDDEAISAHRMPVAHDRWGNGYRIVEERQAHDAGKERGSV